MSTKQAELKSIKAQRKALLEEERKMAAELNEGKAERILARKSMAQARKAVHELRAELRTLGSNTYEAFKGGSEATNKLADDITEKSAELASALRLFADSSESLEEL